MSQLIKKRFPSITSIDVGTDGNTSFLRAARNGQLEKVLEHLESNIDINTSNANGLNALHLASKDGHVEIVEELLKRGAVIDAATKKGNTALHIASLAGQEEVVKLLVTHGASVNVQSQNGFTPLYMAAQENHDNVVKYLLANGANQSLSTEDGFTPLAVAMQQGHDKVVTVLLENDTRGKVRLPALHIAAKKDDVKAAKLLLENEHNPDVTSKSGFTPLHIASHYGNQSIANLLVQKGADVNYAAKHNITPLHVAAKWGKTNMVTVLLEQGANIESKTRDGLTPLHCAARSGHEQVVDMLLEKGAPISSKTKNGLAPLHMAAQGDHVDAARILLYHRAPVDEVTVDYLTALHVAAHCGHVRVAKLLLDRQADANARALNGFTPLHIACKKNRIKVVELLLKHGASIGATTESGLTPLHVASFMGCMNIVIFLLQHDAKPDVPTVRGETPLHLAARANQTDIIRILLRNGAQVDARAREQQTPLHIASRLGNVDIVMLLLQHGANVDNTTKDMYTALHIAAKEGQDEVAAALIDNGASLNATTKKGFTPLHLAAKYGHLKVAKLLLQKEAPVDAQGKNGVTPLHVASHYDHQNVALLLLEKGASPYATAKNGHTPLHIAAKKNQMDIANTLLEYGANPNAESMAGFTPLHLSAQEGHSDMTDLLIEHKADTNHRARNGLTPLHLCAQEDKVPVAEILVKNGGEVDAATKIGYTPLHIASHYGQINMVRFLLSHGANVKANTSLGYTPLHQAAQQGHTNIVNTLLENSAQPNAVTNSGQTPLHIAEKLGYITVIDTLKVVTEKTSPADTSTISNEEKYRVVAPEAMQETFMSDSEEEGGEDTVLGDQTYRYLTADEMKSLGDDSLPIDVTRDERIDSNKIMSNNENMLPPRHIEDNISPEHVQQNYVEYIKKYTPDNVDIDKHPISIGKLHWKNFLVSFLVDARGGAMRGCRHSGVRVIVPPRCASSPTRITCRYVRPQRTPHPPPLMEGEALASRVLELGPVGAKFLGPVIIEVPHFAALRGKEREIVILRSDNGESWKEHTVEATEEVLNEVLHDSFEAEDLNQLEDISSGRITRIVTQDFPQYFAVVSRIRQEVHAIGPEGGMVSSTVVPQVQAVFPQGALTKKIKVGLQAQPIDPELTAKLLGHGVAVSPVVTVEPRRRKFHKAITLSMPAPRAHSQGMINQYSGSAPTLRLLCSITGGTTRAQWEDVTGSTPLTFVNDCVSFTTTVSARFWLMDCRNVGDATKMATELYREAIHVPFMAKFVVFAKRVDPLEARLRVFCMTDDKEDKTLEHQEHFTEVAKSRDVEVLEGKPQYIEFAGNLVPITKSGEQLQFSFRAFRENRLPFSVRVKDQHAEAVSRCLFMRESKLPKGEPPQQPICILNIVLPDDIVVDTISLTDSDSVKKIETFDYYRPDPRLADMSNLLGEDWVPLAAQLGLTTSEINVIKSEYPDSVAKQAQSMLRMWLSQSGNKAQANTLESALRRIGREDIIPQCLNVDYPPHGIKELGKQRLIKKLEENLYEKDIIRDSQSVESFKKTEDEKQKENFDKYSAEEKVVETSDEEDFNKSVTERRHQIEERLSVDRTVPASSQRVEIVQEITSIKRQSLVENKIAEVEQKSGGEIVNGQKTTITSNELTISPAVEKIVIDGDRRDSELLEGVTQRFEQKKITKIISTEDPKSPKVSKTPPPSPADFITKEQAASIQEWDVSKKSAPQAEAPVPQDAEQQGLSTTTERLVASNEETLLDKPLGQQLTGLSDIDDHLATDIKTVCEQTNAFIQSESQPEPFDALADKYSRKEPINEKKADDNKNNMNEKKKAKKGFFGSIKTFVERSFESDSESEKSPKKTKKPKKDKKKKKAEGTSGDESFLPPRKPKLPTPPLEPSDIDTIPFAEATVSDLPPAYKPPGVPLEHQIPVTDLDADFEIEVKPPVEDKPIISVKDTKEDVKPTVPDKEKGKSKEKPKEKEKKKTKTKTVISEEVTKTIQPLVIEAEEFSIVVDPTKKESPKKSKETFTINIDETIDQKEKEILEKSPILSEEIIMKPIAAIEMKSDIPIRPPRIKDHVYEDIMEPVTITIPQDQVKEITTNLIANEINFGGWSDLPKTDEKVEEVQKEIVEKQDKEVLKEKPAKSDDTESKKKEEKKGSFFGLFKKRDSKKEEEAPTEIVEKVEVVKTTVSEEVLKDMRQSQEFLADEVENYHDVRPVVAVETVAAVTAPPPSEPEVEEPKAQSEGFFGLFKKAKKEDKVPSDKKESEKKSKKEDKEKKVAVLLSEEVLKNILDSKRFLEGEVQNYNDVRPTKFEQIEKLLSPIDIVPVAKVIDLEEASSLKSSDDKKEASPKRIDDKREASPKPSPGFFGLFKKSKKDETDAAQTKPVLSDEVIKDIKDTDEFLVAEIEKYEDVKPTEGEKPKETAEDIKITVETTEGQSAGFFGFFKKSKKEEEPTKAPLSEETLKDMSDTTQFLTDEVQNYHDVRPGQETVIEEEKVTESAEQPSGFFGLFKKAKKEEEKVVSEVKQEVAEAVNETIVIEEKTEALVKAEEEKMKKAVEEVRESSPKPAAGFFGLFKKSKKDEEETIPTKPPLSDSVVKEMDDTKQFLSTEVDNYEDVKPEKFEVIQEEKVKTVEASPKSSRGVFGMFKKSKKEDDEPTEPSLPVTIIKEVDETIQNLKDSTEKEEQQVVESEKSTKPLKDGIESSPKSSRGLFGIFKKTKRESEEETEVKPAPSTVVEDMKNTSSFLTGEVEKYHDVKPEKFEAVQEEKVTSVVEEVVEASPKTSRGLFGIFKKSKKEDSIDGPSVISEEVQKEMIETDNFLSVEIENYEDVKDAKEEPKPPSEEVTEPPAKPSKSLFGMFKKSKTKDETEELVAETKEVVTNDVVEVVESLEEEKQKLSDEKTDLQAKASRGIFGIFKSPRKEKEETTETKIVLTEETVQNMADSDRFLTEEVENYHDVKTFVEEKKIVEDKKIVEEAREQSPRPTSGIFSIFKKSKKEESDVSDTEAPTEVKQKDLEELKQVQVAELPIPDEGKILSPEALETKTETTEVKGGFLSKFKKTKKKPSLADTQLSEEVQKSLDETKAFLSTEVENYEDEKPVVTEKEKKDEKTVTFDVTKSKMVLEGQLPEPEVAEVVDVVKTEITDVVKEVDEELKEAGDVVLHEAIEIHVVEQSDIDAKKEKDKQTKEKKGFFQRFGKKSKSQETSLDETRGRSEDEGEVSPKKQKRRKSSSPFKFFEKMKKSEEEVPKEIETVILPKVEDEVKEEIKDDLLAVEFEQEPAMDLSKEVLSSLDKKMEALKSKYTPEVQQQINDCRDFLFIEVDNYDNSKPVVVTDIDTGITTDASKAIDDIIDKAAKAVEETRSLVDEVKTEATEEATKVATPIEETTRKAAKKAEKKSGGFFSKLGNLISGSADEAKNELKEAKKSAEKAAEKTAESTGKMVDTTVKSADESVDKIKKKVEDTQKVASDKVDETKEQTKKEVDEAKVGITELKESLLDVTAKAGERIDSIKISTSSKTQGAITVVQKAKESVEKKVDDVVKEVESTHDKTKSEILKSKDQILDAAQETKRKSEDAIKSVVDETVAAKQQSDQKLSEVKSGVETTAQKGKETATEIVGKTVEKINDLGKAKDDAIESISQKADLAKSDVTDKIQDVKKEVTVHFQESVDATKEKGKEQVDRLTEAKEDVARKLDGVSEALTGEVIKSKDTLIGGLADAKKGLEESVQQKVEEVKKVKDSAATEATTKIDDIKGTVTSKVEESVTLKETIKDATQQKVTQFSEGTSQQIDKVSSMKKDTDDFLKNKVEKVSETKEGIKSAVAAKVDDITFAASQKANELQQTAQDAAKQKQEEVQKFVSTKIEDVKQTKAAVQTEAVKKSEELVKTASHKLDDSKAKIEETITQKREDVSRIQENFLDSLTGLKSDFEKSAQEKVEQTRKAKEDVISVTTSKVDELSKTTSKKIDDLESTKKTFVTSVEQKVDDLRKSEVKYKETVTTKVDKLKETVTQKIDGAAKLKQDVKVATEQKISEVTKAAAQKTKDSEDLIKAKKAEVSKIKDDIKTIAVTKVDDVTTAAAQKVDEIQKAKEKVQDTTKQSQEGLTKLISEKTEDLKQAKTALEAEAAKKSQEVIKTGSQKGKEMKEKVEETVSQKILDVSSAAHGKIDDLISKKGNFEDATKKKTEELTQLTHDVKKSAETEAGKVTQACTEEVEEIVKTKDAVGAELHHQTKSAKETLVKKTTKFSEPTSQKADEFVKELGTLKISTSEKKDQLLQDASQKMDSSKGKVDEAVKSAGKKVDDGAKTVAFKTAELDDQLTKLASSLDQLADPIKGQVEKVKSYVTSPTMARRAESQRISRDERPAVREVRSPQVDDEETEALYTVTEPEDVEHLKRKPLFHIESEDDDSLDSSRVKERRDSVKSNVLETLSENKLDNLLSDLETQLVKDLEESVTDGGQKVTVELTKAESELETMKKDSQADVDQIEQKLRDLDKALDSLEQASDPKLEKKLHRVERKFERMASEVMDKDGTGVSPTEVEARREHEFQRLVSQLSTEEVSDFQKEYSHLWDETTFSKSDDWDSKTPDSQADVQELPQGEVVYMGPVTLNKDNLINKAGVEVDVIPIMRSPCHTPKPTKKNKRAKSAMDFYEGSSPPKEFDRGSLPDLKRTSLKGSLISTIIQLNPDRFLYGSTTSLRSTASSSSDLSRGEVMNAVLDWLDKSNRTSESLVDTASLASSDSNISQMSAKTNPGVPTILITKGSGKKRSKSKGKSERRETTCAPTLTEDLKTIPQPKPRFAKETPLQFNEERQPKLEKQISPVRDDLLDEEESAPETYSDKKKFWENVTKDKRMSLNEGPTQEKDVPQKRASVHEVPVPKPRSQVQVSSISESKVTEEPELKIMSEYQASFQPPSERKSKTPPKVESDKESSDSDSEVLGSGNNDNAGYISDSGDVEHYISDSEIEDRVPQIRERQMSVFAPPVAAGRKSIYERSASLPTEDLYEVSARSIKLRKQYYEEQIKKEMIEEQLTSEIEEEPSPERKTLISSLVQQLSEEKVSVRDIARSFDEATKKEVSFENDFQTHKPETTIAHIEDQTPISQQFQETHKEIDGDSQTKRSSLGSEQSSSSDVDKVTRTGSSSKPDSMEVHVDKSEIEDSEKLAELDQDATDVETKSLDSLNIAEISPKSSTFQDDHIPEITVTLSGKQRRISEESDEYAPKAEKKTELDSPINVPEEHVEDTVWEVSVQSQPEAHFDKVTSFDSATVEKIERDEDLSLSTRDESDLGSEIHQDHSDSYSDKIKSESHSDIERIIMDSLQHQKVDPIEAKAIASALIEEIEAEIHRRECSPPSASTGDVSDYLKYLAETKGLDEREVELVESVLARRQRELAKLSRGDTQASSIEITDEDLRYSGTEVDTTHLLEQQISQLKAEKFEDLKSMNFLDKIDEKHAEESHQSKDYETYGSGVTTAVKSEIHTKTFESIKGEKSEAKDVIFEEDETISESATHESEELETQIEVVTTEALHKKSDEKDTDEYRKTSVDVSKERAVDVTTKRTDVEAEDSHRTTSEDARRQSDVTKSVTKHQIDVAEKSPTEEVKLTGQITTEDYASTEESTKKELKSEVKQIEGGAFEKAEAKEKSHTKVVQKESLDKATEEKRTHENEDSIIKQSTISSRVTSTDVIRESSTVTKVTEKVEVLDLDQPLLVSDLEEVKTIDRHEEIKRTSSSESKSSIESGKSPEDQFSTCSSGRKGDSDSSKVAEKPEVLMRKASSLQKADRKSGIEFEAYSSSGESHYHSFELDSGKSRPCSSDVEGMVAAGSSEYESALTSQDYSSRSHITSTEYHTAVSSLSSKESMKSLDSESSGHLGSVEVSELSETLVPSTSDADGDILDTADHLDDVGWNDELIDEPSDTQSKMKRSHEMTFQPEPKILTVESPQTEELDKKFTSMDDGSIVSMSLSSTSGTTEPRTVIELSRADSEKLEGGSMSVSGISDQLSIEGSCDSLVFHQTTPLTTTEMGTSTGQIESNLQIESITFTTSVVTESGIRNVSTQVTSESHSPEEERAKKVEEPQPNGKCPSEVKKKSHRRQESTSSFVPPVLPSFDQKFQSDLTESDKYTAELSFKEVISDEKKDIDEREREESYETEADQGFHRDVREGKYQETEEEIKDDTPEFSSETQASVGELEQEYSSALARAQEVRKKSETSPDLHIHKEPLEKRDSHGKSSSTSSEKSSFEEAEAEAAFNMVAHVSPAHKIKQICPILEDEDAEKHELETRERAQKEYEKRRSQVRDQSPGSIPDIKVTQHMTPLVDRNFRYPDLELEEQERAKEKEKESETQKSTPQTPSSKSSEDTDQGREYVLEDSGISIPEETTTESKSTVIEQTVKEEADKDTDSPNSDSFEMLEKPDLIDDFVVIEEVAKEAHEFDSEGKSVSIQSKSTGQKQRSKKHDEEVEAYLTRSAPTPLTKMTEVKYYPDGSSSEELGFDFEDSPPVNPEAAASNYEQELEANKKWIEQQFQGDQAAKLAAGYDYEVDFERGPLEDIKEEDINDFDPSSRIGSLGSQKESGGSLGSVKDSYSSTPEYDVLAGRKYFTRSGEHDDISMSSLQEFENLERAMSLETKRYHQGSQDSSSNGSFKTRYNASKSGQGDDVSVSSLKEFEGLEMACIAAHKVETKAKEEEAMLAQIDEGQESIASESESCETVSRTDKKIIPDSDEEDYEKRMFEIDEIIKQAQSNVERFIDLKEGDKTESLGRGDSIEEVAKVPDLDLDAPLVKSTVKVQWKENEDVMITSTDSIDGKEEKESQHDSTDSLDQKTCADIMTASTDSIEFQAKKTEPEPINLLSDSIEIKDEACGMISSDSLELATKHSETMLESTDSLMDPTSSTATHATYQYETDSVFSGSFTSGGSNTMVSSTDTIDPVQVDIAAAARKVWFDEDAGSSRRFTTEYIQEAGKPYVTEVIEPSEDDAYSHTIHRRVELPPEVKKITFYGSDADQQLKQFIEDFNEGEHVEEVQEVDASGNVHTRRVVQRRFIVKGEDGREPEELIQKTVASKTNQLTSYPKETTGEESTFAATGGSKDSSFKAQGIRRRQLRYEISVDDQIEVDPREHDWRFNLPEHAEGEESATSGQQTDKTSSQQKSVTDQHQLSEEMKELLKELEKESKQ